MKLRLDAKYVPLLATAAVLAALYVGGCIRFADRNFGTLLVARNLFGNNAFLGVAAIGATFVILSGGIDLSVGSVVACTTILVAMLVERWGVPPAAAIPIALAVGALFGATMGCLIHFFALPPFLVTLGGLFFGRGMAFFICPQPPEMPSLNILHPFYKETVAESLVIPLTESVSLPFEVVCFAVIFLFALYVLHFTKFGRNVYAIGGDERAAVLMGLPVGRTRILVYTVGGLCSAAAGVVYTLGATEGDPTGFVGLELDAIAAVVIGGTLLSGGVGFLAGTLMGVLIRGLIKTLITNEGTLSSWWTSIAIGTLLLLFILLQGLVSRTSRRAGGK